MAIAILGGLVTSTLLNLLVLPVLALRFGKCLLCSPAPLFGLKSDAEKMRESALRAESGMDIAEYRFATGTTNQRSENG